MHESDLNSFQNIPGHKENALLEKVFNWEGRVTHISIAQIKNIVIPFHRFGEGIEVVPFTTME